MPGIGTLLGGIAGTAFGSPGLGMAAGGFLDSLFGGGASTTDAGKYERQKAQSEAYNYLDYAKNTFGNANSQYYQKAMGLQKQSLLDTYLGFDRMARQMNRATGGSSASGGAIFKALANASEAKATSGAQKFGTGLYLGGMNKVGDAYKNLTNTFTATGNQAMGVGLANQETKASFDDQLYKLLGTGLQDFDWGKAKNWGSGVWNSIFGSDTSNQSKSMGTK